MGGRGIGEVAKFTALPPVWVPWPLAPARFLVKHRAKRGRRPSAAKMRLYKFYTTHAGCRSGPPMSSFRDPPLFGRFVVSFGISRLQKCPKRGPKRSSSQLFWETKFFGDFRTKFLQKMLLRRVVARWFRMHIRTYLQSIILMHFFFKTWCSEKNFSERL